MSIAAIAPIIVIASLFVIYCWWDLARIPATRGLPKIVWALICVMTIPLGGILYLALGRDLTPRDADGSRD